ncbi:MAG: 5'-deoxynucleotidase [Halothiobacillus sp.]|nr:5'-deoxynucleotidase [Halothiobacillus sp.]
MKSPFLAVVSRLRHVWRWSLMHNSRQENVQEHSLQVAQIAHMLALIANEVHGQSIDQNKAAVIAMYHDAAEAVLGADIPTPSKYFSPEILKAHRDMEFAAESFLVDMLPEQVRGHMRPLICHSSNDDERLAAIVKAADTISAFLKCLEELRGGNTEFESAKRSIEGKINRMIPDMPEVGTFLEWFESGFSKTVDVQMMADRA